MGDKRDSEEKRGINGYSPRPQFIDFHNRKQRWAVMVCHRRAGKTVSCIADLVLSALVTNKQDARYAYIAPQYVQAKDIAWLYVKNLTSDIPGVQYNESELRCDLPNGSRIRLYGAENQSRLKGLYLDGVIFDEYADMPPSVWGEVVRPLLSDRKGWAVFIGTPRGHNAFYDIWQSADEEWFRLMLKASESGIIDPKELEAARRDMTQDQFEQEFLCSFEAAIRGAYYGKEMKLAEEEGRICAVPHEVGVETWVSFDLGMDDSTVLWFAQYVGREIHIIDYYEAHGMALDHYVKVLREKPYVYAGYLLPHDAKVRELGTGKSRLETLENLGLKHPTVVPAQNIEDGINAVRMMLPKCWFDARKCKTGIEALKQYRSDYDEKRSIYSARPIHDWSSHAADAFRYLAQGMKPVQKWQPIKYPEMGIV